ncbi:MAG: DUF808 domain-containing protein [Mangrovicoccus sp.]
MSSGLLALLDDVAAIAKVAATSVDDVAGMTAKAGSKAAGVVIDDAAVTPRYVMGLSPAREVPIVAKIAKGSIFNKLVILLPGALLLSVIAPWAITPILMLGGFFLCYEGAEKVLELFHKPKAEGAEGTEPKATTPEELEAIRVKSAVQTDLILSAEIMAIALSTIPDSPLWEQAIVLAVVAVAITAGVYGAVALIVKADDLGVHLAGKEGQPLVQKLGHFLVKAMPFILFALAKIGMIAMLWVGGGILIHGAEVLGWHDPAESIHDIAHAAGHALYFAEGALAWTVGALISALVGLVIGLALVPLINRFRGGQH